MTKRYKIILIFCFLILSIFFTGCPFMENLNHTKILDFELSSEEIKINIPVELTIRYCFEELDENILCAVRKIDNMEISVIEGEKIDYESNNAIFVKFIKSDNKIKNNYKSPYDLNPYCKLCLTFSKPGTYSFRIISTDEEKLQDYFDGWHIELLVNVTE